jgi:5-methyltetrahydropteroyltriglutamate--homocysteine methyltransferase
MERSLRTSTDRILVSHAGTLPRSPELSERVEAGERDPDVLEKLVAASVSDVVAAQTNLGIDIINDGEHSKHDGFLRYARTRISGIEGRPSDTPLRPVDARDRLDFPGFYAAGLGGRAGMVKIRDATFAVAPLTYSGHEAVRRDTERIKAAAAGLDVEPFLSSVAPGTLEHAIENDYYPDTESLLFALADVLHEEYQAIADAGILLQIDDPDLPDGWQLNPAMDLAEYRKYAELRVEAINHALRGIPPEQVRLHVCWGSQHGPHQNDIALRDIVDIVLKVNAGCYSVEAANPMHEHEWRVWEEVALPDGKLLMPGAVAHSSVHIEHPDVVADRLVRFAEVVGRERVIAGTDCGLATRLPHAEIAWAKLRALVAGARQASARLWP